MKLLRLTKLNIKATPFRSNGPFDGSSVMRAIPMPHDKTWLESQGKRVESTADEYCAIFDKYLAGGWAYQEFLSAMTKLGRIS